MPKDLFENQPKDLFEGTDIKPQKKPLSAFKRYAFGALEPIDAAAQMLYNSLPESVQKAGDRFNNWVGLAEIPEGGFNYQLAENLKKYQAGKPETDVARTAGNITSGILATRKVPMGTSLKSMAKGGAIAGGVLGPLQPVYDPGVAENSFWAEKGKQAGIGAGFGIASAPVGYSLSRVVNPKAASNMDVKTLKDAGINPTIGQTMGGWINRTEEKAQSLPIVGDAIMSARSGARDLFNTAAINKALSSIGVKVKGAGYDAIDQAQKAVSKAYDDALTSLQGVKLDSISQRELSSLNELSSGLSKDLQRTYKRFITERIKPMISPSGGMESQTFKVVDSELRKKATQYGKGSAAEQELGNLFKELRSVLYKQAERTNPEAAKALKNADTAFANMVRIENAAKSSVANDGVFTPGQLMGGIRQADQSVRKRGFSGGNALMQDFARSGQKVLGNKYPDSGTAGRLFMDAAALLGGGMYSPWLPISLIGTAGLYTKPVQNMLTAAITKRPENAQAIANLIKQSTPGAALPFSGLLQSGN